MSLFTPKSTKNFYLDAGDVQLPRSNPNCWIPIWLVLTSLNQADIWSLGITVIEMAEGRPPNTDIRSIEQLPKILERPPPTLKAAKKFSAKFNEFIAACLVKDVNDRPEAKALLSVSLNLSRLLLIVNWFWESPKKFICWMRQKTNMPSNSKNCFVSTRAIFWMFQEFYSLNVLHSISLFFNFWLIL